MGNGMKQLPQDPVILMSYVNTQLRDFYPSLAAFCEDRELEEEALCARLSEAGFQYSREQNRFI